MFTCSRTRPVWGSVLVGVHADALMLTNKAHWHTALCVCVCVCVCVCECICMCLWLWVCVPVSLFIFVCVFVCICVIVCLCMCACVCVCVGVGGCVRGSPGREGHRDPLHPQCHPLHRGHPGPVSPVLPAGLPAAQRQLRGHQRLVSPSTVSLLLASS